MKQAEKPPKHWSERLIAVFCIICIIGIVVTDNALELWAKPPPDWLYIGLAFVALGVTTEDAKQVLLSFVRNWAKAVPPSPPSPPESDK